MTPWNPATEQRAREYLAGRYSQDRSCEIADDLLESALRQVRSRFDDLLGVLVPHLTPSVGEALNNLATVLAVASAALGEEP